MAENKIPPQYFTDGTYIYTQDPQGNIIIVGNANMLSGSVDLGGGLSGNLSSQYAEDGSSLNAELKSDRLGLAGGVDAMSQLPSGEQPGFASVNPYVSANLSQYGLPATVKHSFANGPYAPATTSGSLETPMGTLGANYNRYGAGLTYDRQLGPNSYLSGYYNTSQGMPPEYGITFGYQRKF